jgi:hypothetical protein
MTGGVVLTPSRSRRNFVFQEQLSDAPFIVALTISRQSAKRIGKAHVPVTIPENLADLDLGYSRKEVEPDRLSPPLCGPPVLTSTSLGHAR